MNTCACTYRGFADTCGPCEREAEPGGTLCAQCAKWCAQRQGAVSRGGARVCLTHERVNVCRVDDGCVWSEERADVERVAGQQARGHED